MVAESDNGTLVSVLSRSDSVSESSLVPSVHLINTLTEIESSVAVLSEIGIICFKMMPSSIVMLSDNGRIVLDCSVSSVVRSSEIA